MALSDSERSHIEQELSKTKATTASVVEAISSLNASLVIFKERSYQTMSDIRTAADLIVNEIRTHEEKLVSRVQEIIDMKQEYVEQQKKTLEDYVAELQQSIDYTSDVLNSPTQPEIDEWKSALTCQLNQVNGMKDGYNYELDMNDEGKFLFVYANQDLLKSVANYGTIMSDVPDACKFSHHDDNFMESEQNVTVIPIVTLNGTILDLDAVSEEESDEESSDDERDTTDNDDSTNDEDDDDDDDDNNNNDDGVGVDRCPVKKTYPRKSKLSTLI